MPATRERIGNKNHRITIQRATKTQNSRGEVVLTWPGTTVDTVWAERQESAGGEGVAADQLFATRTVRYVIWYRTDLLAEMRLMEGTRVFEIKAINDLTGSKLELELLCLELGA